MSSRIIRSNHFTPTQDQIIVDAVCEGGYNNLQNTFEQLSFLPIFIGYTPKKIANRYYWTIRRNIPMFQIKCLVNSTVARVNYKNDPLLWTGATRRNNNTNI